MQLGSSQHTDNNCLLSSQVMATAHQQQEKGNTTNKQQPNAGKGKGSVDCYGSSNKEPALAVCCNIGAMDNNANAEVAAILTAVATHQALAGMLISYN